MPNNNNKNNHEKCQKIFKALKTAVSKQQSQLDSLLADRSLLHDRYNLLFDRCQFDAKHFQNHISQLEREVSSAEMAKQVEIKKAKLLVGLKEREALVYKLKLEYAESELKDFKEWFDYLSHRCPNQEDISADELYERLKAKGGRDSSSEDISPDELYERLKAKGGRDGSSVEALQELEKEVERLKREYDKLSVKNRSDVSALQTEVNFVWNQYKEMESKYTNQLESKDEEVNQANEKIKKVLDSMEQLQSLNAEKDGTILSLRSDIIKLEAEATLKNEDISRLTKELESLRFASSAGVPLLQHCSGKLSPSRSTGRRKGKTLEKAARSNQVEDLVATLRAKITELEAEGKQKGGEISSLSKELQGLRSKDIAETPVQPCTGAPSSSRSRGRGNGLKKRSVASPTEPVNEQGLRRSKRKIGGSATPDYDQLQATGPPRKAKRPKTTELKAEANQKDEAISSLSKELQLLRSKGAAGTPVLRPCTGEPSSSRSRGRGNGGKNGSAASSAEPVDKQGLQRSKRKLDDSVRKDETPKLFTSQFKIPKLKSQSPRGR